MLFMIKKSNLSEPMKIILEYGKNYLSSFLHKKNYFNWITINYFNLKFRKFIENDNKKGTKNLNYFFTL